MKFTEMYLGLNFPRILEDAKQGLRDSKILEQAAQYKAAPRDTEEMKLWLFDLAHGNLLDDEVLSGFIKHYVLRGLTVDHIASDIIYHTTYGELRVAQAKASVLRVLMEAGKVSETDLQAQHPEGEG